MMMSTASSPSQPGNPNVESGTGKRGGGGGGGAHLYSRSSRLCTSSKSGNFLKEFPASSPFQKTQSRARVEERVAQPAGFSRHGTSPACVRACVRSSARSAEIKHKHTSAGLSVWVGCAAAGPGGGGVRPPAGTGSSLMKLALVFTQLYPQG